MKNKKWIFALIFAVSIISAGAIYSATASDVSDTIKQLEAEGKLPVLDTSDSVAGTDADKNGIRDDIDAYIEQQQYSPEIKAAVQQKAKSYQKVVTTDLLNQAAIDASRMSVQRSNKCMFDRFEASPLGADGFTDASLIMDKLKAMTLNTKQRLTAWYEFDKKMDGQVFSQVQGEPCDK
jgi:MFS superfamily sulfate permease-like transporter